MKARQYGLFIFLVLVSGLLGACGAEPNPPSPPAPLSPTATHPLATPTLPAPTATHPPASPTLPAPTATYPPASPTLPAPTATYPPASPTLPAPTATYPPAVCPLGAALRKDTIDLQLAYPGPGRLYWCWSRGLAQSYFGQLEGGLRVLIGPSLATLQEKAERAGQAGLPYEALGYNLEDKENRTIEERTDLVGATRQAADLAHEHGRLLMMVPGFKLMQANWSDYPQLAAYADLWVIQSLQLQKVYPPGPTYRQEVEKVIHQIRAGNPNIPIWVQITVVVKGQVLSAEEVLAYRQAIADLVDGVFIYDARDPNRPETLEAILAAVCGSG
jgi:hypothetical protein